tara:strand:- start:351 stop:734 length:384 start_codon:yes stop_codon:yes gene_type:complete
MRGVRELPHYDVTGIVADGIEVIQSYQARVHWGSVLTQVGEGQSFLVNRRHQAVAMIVPIQDWNDLQERDDENGPEARELSELVEKLNKQNQETSNALDEAFAALSETRKALAEMRMEREQEMEAAQ